MDSQNLLALPHSYPIDSNEPKTRRNWNTVFIGVGVGFMVIFAIMASVKIGQEQATLEDIDDKFATMTKTFDSKINDLRSNFSKSLERFKNRTETEKKFTTVQFDASATCEDIQNLFGTYNYMFIPVINQMTGTTYSSPTVVQMLGYNIFMSKLNTFVNYPYVGPCATGQFDLGPNYDMFPSYVMCACKSDAYCIKSLGPVKALLF